MLLVLLSPLGSGAMCNETTAGMENGTNASDMTDINCTNTTMMTTTMQREKYCQCRDSSNGCMLMYSVHCALLMIITACTEFLP